MDADGTKTPALQQQPLVIWKHYNGCGEQAALGILERCQRKLPSMAIWEYCSGHGGNLAAQSTQ